MSNHLFKSRFGQCECRWCGKRRGGDCQVTQEMRYALKLFAKGNGRAWKSKLRQEWETGGYGLGDHIQQPLMLLRNIIGPTGLDKLPSHLLDDVLPPKARSCSSATAPSGPEATWSAGPITGSPS